MDNTFKPIDRVHFWCQKVLPLAYDDSLSYYEFLCKVCDTLNMVIEDLNAIPDFIRELVSDERLKEILSELLDELREQIASANEGVSKTATADRKIGDFVWLNGLLYKVTHNMIAGDQYVENSNCIKITIEEELKTINASIIEEVTNRKNVDKELTDKINTETMNRENADTELTNKINTETTNRENADTIINNKLNSITPIVTDLNKHNLKWVNAIKYGFVNDGVTNNDAIMQKFIENDSDKVLYFENGNYSFANSINFPVEMHLYLDPNAVLTMNSVVPVEYFITIRKGSTRSDYSKNSFICGGTINCNYKANNGFGSHKCTCKGLLDGVRITNVLQCGIVASTEPSVDGANVYRNVSIENTKGVNETEVLGTCGIWDVATDNTYINIDMVNMQTGIRTVNGTFSNIKMWIRSKNLIGNSLGVYVWGKAISFVNLVIDTYRYGFSNTDENEQKVTVTNLWWIRNGGVYTNEIADQNESVIFRSDNPSRNFYITNAIIQVTRNTKFSNIPLPNSSFLNIVTENGSPISTLENGRNDSVKVITVRGTTDQYGQLSYNNYADIKSVTVHTPERAFACVFNGGILILTTNGSSISPASNKSVVLNVIL